MLQILSGVFLHFECLHSPSSSEWSSMKSVDVDSKMRPLLTASPNPGIDAFCRSLRVQQVVLQLFLPNEASILEPRLLPSSK